MDKLLFINKQQISYIYYYEDIIEWDTTHYIKFTLDWVLFTEEFKTKNAANKFYKEISPLKANKLDG